MGVKATDETGKRYGRLTVLRYSHAERGAFWLCECDCGKQIVTKGGSLRNGSTSSCGCYKREIVSERSKTHGEGHKATAEYRTWTHIKTRCFNVNSPDYPDYGGRGITICERWANSYEDFLSDMGRRPEGMNSIDRIDNEGDYEPGNCRCASAKVQANNRRKRIKYPQHNGRYWSKG